VPISEAEAGEVRKIACQEVRGGNHRAAYEAELPGLTGWISCQPLAPSRGGGDVYYMSACSKGVTARVALADVAGHGGGVSVAAGRLRDALRRTFGGTSGLLWMVDWLHGERIPSGAEPEPMPIPRSWPWIVAAAVLAVAFVVVLGPGVRFAQVAGH